MFGNSVSSTYRVEGLSSKTELMWRDASLKESLSFYFETIRGAISYRFVSIVKVCTSCLIDPFVCCKLLGILIGARVYTRPRFVTNRSHYEHLSAWS